MRRFTIKLAGIPIRVHALHRRTRTFCRSYLTREAPAFEVRVTREDLAAERQRNARQMALEGREQADYSDAYIETLALYRKIAAELLAYDVLLFHGAVVACEGRAYIFTAKSGVGKTTHAKLWLENIPGSYILNGDKPLLLFRDGVVYACGTPWMGKEHCGVNEMLPVAGICLLERAKENRLAPLSLGEAFPGLLAQAHCPEAPGAMVDAVRLLGGLSQVRTYRLECNMQAEAALVAYRGMTEGLRQPAAKMRYALSVVFPSYENMRHVQHYSCWAPVAGRSAQAQGGCG